MIDFDELERKEREATEGPWDVGRWKIFDEDEGFELTACGHKVPMDSWTGSVNEAEANSALIAALRNAAPELIAMARRYQWLREHTVATGLSRWVHPHQFLDAAIDAAMQEQKR